jgi:phosphohistidine phosphatase SixA
MTTLLDLIAELSEDVHTAVIVGHNPTLRDVIAMTCEEDALQQEAILKFPTSSVAVLVTDLAWSGAAREVPGFRVEAFTVPRA